jgi:aryl-alcohol dehydrogenase-like predicted oxidoreductase
MIARPLGSTGLRLSPIGFGSFKIGRNRGTKYAEAYELPSAAEATALVRGALELGVRWFDTAPAYGLAETRLGAALAERPADVVLSTKVGERFDGDRSAFDFSAPAVTDSLAASAAALRVERIDLVFVHSSGDDEGILRDGAVTRALRAARDAGQIGHLGFSGKTAAGFRLAMDEGYEALMVEYHPLDPSMRPILEEAAARGVGAVIKKPLASGRIPAEEAIPFALAGPGVAALALSSLRIDRYRAAIRLVGG